MKRQSLLPLAAIASLSFTSTSNAAIIIFNGIAGANNTAVPTTFGSNLTADAAGVTISNGATPDIALAWAGGSTGTGGQEGWDLNGGQNAPYWVAMDPANSAGPVLAQMEDPSATEPMTIAFSVGADTLRINSVDIGMASDKTDTYYWNVTVTEAGATTAAFSTITAAMDGDGGSGVQALTVDIDFTGAAGTDYILAFNNVNQNGSDTIATNNGGAIDNLSFNQIPVPEPSSTALLGLGGLALMLRRRR